MSVNNEYEKLIATLKFTPCKYQVSIWGYGGEIVLGSVKREIFDYFKKRRLSVPDYAWNNDAVDELEIPEDMQPFEPGSWYDCDDLAHVNGASRDSSTIQITDNKGNVVLERLIDSIDGTDIQLCCDQEAWVGMAAPGEAVFVGRSNEKGTFFEGEIELTAPFDLEKLTICYDEVDGEEIVTGIMYDDQYVENNGGSTDGKSSDFCFCLIKDNDSWEKYVDHDSIVYPLTDWFPADIDPVRPGMYDIETAGKSSYNYHAKWTGSRWVNSWDTDETETLAIKQWRGIKVDPDADIEFDPVKELDKILADFDLGEKA